MADANAIRRIFTNLIQNVLKHNGKNFSVVLRQKGNRVITSFENDAPQLGEEDAQRLFERFYTADRMRSGQNTGLGLAIVKELAEGMNGIIGAELRNNRLCITISWHSI
jgi:signal transduction histidine kinase